jgi:hypothetical protein
MKLSNIILTTTLVLGVSGIFASNIILKKEYDKVDKDDPYWNYGKVQDQPFRHVNIKGGNITNIVFEQSRLSSVRILKSWRGIWDGSVKTYVKNDTLYVSFPNEPKDLAEKFWLMRIVPVRIFCPELLSVAGFDTRLLLDKYNHRNLRVKLSGKSRLRVSSYVRNMDKVEVSQKDSSDITVAMSRDLEGPGEMKINQVVADCAGTSLLDLQTSDIEHLDINLADTAAIALSGTTLKKWKK